MRAAAVGNVSLSALLIGFPVAFVAVMVIPLRFVQARSGGVSLENVVPGAFAFLVGVMIANGLSERRRGVGAVLAAAATGLGCWLGLWAAGGMYYEDPFAPLGIWLLETGAVWAFAVLVPLAVCAGAIAAFERLGRHAPRALTGALAAAASLIGILMLAQSLGSIEVYFGMDATPGEVTEYMSAELLSAVVCAFPAATVLETWHWPSVEQAHRADGAS